MIDFDLGDPGLLLREDVLDDPGPLYDRLRRDAPVWRIPGQDTYLVSDPALIREAVGRQAGVARCREAPRATGQPTGARPRAALPVKTSCFAAGSGW